MKTVHALDCPATVIGKIITSQQENIIIIYYKVKQQFRVTENVTGNENIIGLCWILI
jgi:hypothetical protein